MQARTWQGARREGLARARVQPWRIAVLAAVTASHVGLVVVLSRPVPARPPALPTTPVERIQLVEVGAPPAPPANIRPPRRALHDSAVPSRAPLVPIASGSRALAVSEARKGNGIVPRHAPSAGMEGPAASAPSSFTPPPASSRALRNPGHVRLPGRGDAIVEGIHVRERPSIEDRVLGVSALLFGGGRPETCNDVRQRLLGAGPGLARDMDVERLKRLCID